jgi:hypothetical protein
MSLLKRSANAVAAESGMSIVTDVKCECGRVRPHCRHCGSSVTYAKQSIARIDTIAATGEKVLVMGYVCRRCGRCYHADSPCAAPKPKVPNKRERNRAEGHSDDFDREEIRKRAVESGLVTDLIEGLKKLNPDKYADIDSPGADSDSSDSRTVGVQPVNDNDGITGVQSVNDNGQNEVDKKKLPPTSTVGDEFFG